MPITSEWQVQEAARLIRLVKFLNARADDKGKTHGEKHHIHETIGMILEEALKALDNPSSIMERNLPDQAPSDIPF